MLPDPPRSSDGSAGKEDTDSTGGIGVGDTAAGIVFATEGPLLSMFQVLFPVPLVPSLGPSTDSSSERSITGIGSLSVMISLREYEDDDDDVVLLGSSTRVPSLLSKIQRFKPSIEPRCSDTTCDAPNPATRSTAAE
ncbi:hypothetical protein M9H77_12593 [Catharanthus roseus]|uniref:Uncharacterized protein n=1 Tax=Catharanthus roseus TaxID=4058 RepID=A0ACC0BHS9_CATRO|nr:hypothetical protein M9H77_12593 [Catharanthus roseus]